MQAIHQLVAGYAESDAISNEARFLRGIFRSWGCESGIFSERRRISPRLRNEVNDLSDTVWRPDDIALLHLSIGSPINDAFAALPCRKAILYHNITPSSFFKIYQPQTAALLENGRRQMAALARTASVVMADSAFNARELEAVGYPPVTVLPLVLDFSFIRGRRDEPFYRRWKDGRRNILFVGRVAPNKRQEDLLAAFHYFQKYVCPLSRLLLVGSFLGMETYQSLLLAKAKEYNLSYVDFVGSVSQPHLLAAYDAADAFLCLSDHEGFCIPVLEAMIRGVPVVAYDAGAIAETMDGAGILVKEKRFDWIAETLGRVCEDQALRQALVAGQNARVARYEARDLGRELRTALAPLLS
jgi:glycosyltransferase involved in cell wall biosynthesis